MSFPQYLKYVEKCAWEGEKWTVYVELVDEDSCNKAAELLDACEDYGLGSDYRISFLDEYDSEYNEVFNRNFGSWGHDGYYPEFQLLQFTDSMQDKFDDAIRMFSDKDILENEDEVLYKLSLFTN